VSNDARPGEGIRGKRTNGISRGDKVLDNKGGHI